jgi:biopolymer transport protein TolR
MAGGLMGKGRGRYRPLAEINVTPLVDVMLVLLIIFMVTAPLLSTAVNVDLPKTSASPVSQDSEPLNVSVNAEGQVFLQDQPIGLPDLVAKLSAIAKEQKDRRIFVRGDKTNTYGKMMEVMGTIIQGGFTKVSLLTDPSGIPAPVAPAPDAAAPAAPATPAAAPAKPAAARG